MTLNSGEPARDNGAEESTKSPQAETPMNGSSSKEDHSENMKKSTKALLLLSVSLSMFLVALDRTIISTVRTNSSSRLPIFAFAPRHDKNQRPRSILICFVPHKAIPEITNDFNSLNDVGWYGSAYLLSTCAFQLLFGKIYTLFSVKAVYVVSTVLFEIGSILCGAAPNTVVFIVGRAICGVGAAGLFTGTVRPTPSSSTPSAFWPPPPQLPFFSLLAVP